MNTISAAVAGLLFFALLYGLSTLGITLPIGIVLPSVVGGLVVGAVVK